jgi:hypothetical protein
MTALAFVAVLVVTAVWFLLPLIPALREFFRPTDDGPLDMVGLDAGDLTVFANGFRAYLSRQMPLSLTGRSWRSEAIDALRDGTPVAQLNGRPGMLEEVLDENRTAKHLVMAGSPLRLQGQETFLLELYARSDFVGGPDAAYRALLAESDAELGERSSVLRWVHAEGILVARAGTQLPGRASAGRELRMDYGVEFARVRAPRIVTGPVQLQLPAAPAPLLTSTFRLPSSARRLRTFVRVADDLSIPARETLGVSLVVEGMLRIGAGARVAGSVKAHGPIVVEDGAVVDGALVSRETIEVGANCQIGGPLIAERHATIRRGTSIGRSELPATVTCSSILLEEGCQIFGALAARDRGRVGAPASAHAHAS